VTTVHGRYRKADEAPLAGDVRYFMQDEAYPLPVNLLAKDFESKASMHETTTSTDEEECTKEAGQSE